ncbi:adenylate/guanylate cyclase domain-containing protein [Dongia deserti]|uniref:adenylate/guanylate cyclase domain-containing protein n=1 Tax=Dongia deserti TaxID=2268030 RepID=UPI000E6505CF|nr:adenylate/guanylate cyclase domain-containing protein [Dongia deserti]
MTYPVPANETERVTAVRATGLLDSAPEIAYDDIGELAAQICQCPVAYVGFMDDDRLWLKAKYGLPPDFNQCPREIAFCTSTVCGVEMVNAPDVTEHPWFKNLPFVVGPPHFRFYCGIPLVTAEGYALGTLCVMDFQVRHLTPEQLESLRRLSRQLLGQLELRRRLVELDQAQREAAAERERSESLLANVLPRPVADELKGTGKVAPRYFSATTILFADMKEFTRLTELVEPAALINLLDQYFTTFDDICVRHQLERIKTMGDAYLAIAGVPHANPAHAIDACLAALEIQATVARMKAQRERARLPALEVRIGLHSGPAIAGLVGKRRFSYDVWGDAVNIAASMEANGAPGRINISDTLAGQVSKLFELEPRGSVEVKNKEAMRMHFLNGLSAGLAREPERWQPNERFTAERNRLLTGYAG